MTTDPKQLLALAGRVKGASGPDRELDAQVQGAVWEHNCRNPIWDCGPVEPYTSSLDAAMSLVPEGVREWHAGKHFKTGQGQAYLLLAMVLRDPIYRLAATPALALVAACLRARAALAQEGNPHA